MISHPGNYFKYVWETFPLNYYNTLGSVAMIIVSLSLDVWPIAIFFGLIFGAAMYINFLSFSLWKERIELHRILVSVSASK